MNKEIKKLFIVLFLYSLAGGFFYNFQELWMESNNLSISTIGKVYSICALLSVSIIFLCSNLIKQNQLKKFTSTLLVLKSIITILLFFLNMSGYNILIKFLIMMDYVVDVEIYASIYPMIALIGKSDKKYALNSILYEIAYYIAVIISVLILGKSLGNLQISYNFYLLLASVILILAFIILYTTNLEQYYKNKEEKRDLNKMKKLVKKVSKDRVIKNYLLHTLTNNISYECIIVLLLLILTNNLGFSASSASNLKMILGISSSILGLLTLTKLTFKNNYINLSIKYVTRLILYILAVIFNNEISFLIALIFTRASSESYTHISSGPYINRVESEDQLAFCNLRSMISYLGDSIGALLSGIALAINIRYNFIVASIFSLLSIIFAFNALYLKNKEDKEK